MRLAATVILVRSPLEVYMTRRSASSAFAPDAFVFPGGTIEAQDASLPARTRSIGLDTARLADEFRATIPPALASSEPPIGEAGARSLLLAALRELFDEAGVLLAAGASERPLASANVNWERVAEVRVAVRSG
jgi:8-oxo-dGTP pyrophosphatase MutT (NUDIX family)